MREIDDVKISYDKTGTVYEQRYYAASLDDYLNNRPKINSKQSWSVGTVYIREVSNDPLKGDNGPQIVTIKAGKTSVVDLTYTENPEEEIELLEGIYSRLLSTADLYFPPEWWGLHKAATTDVEKKVLNIAGKACAKGDYLFKGAKPTQKGEPDYQLCPIQVEDGGSLDTKFIGITVKTHIYTCVFHRKGTLNVVDAFNGVSGVIPSFLQPRSFGPKRWRAVDQKAEEIRNNQGVKYAKITRIIQLCPGGGLWDSVKNGGTWIWK